MNFVFLPYYPVWAIVIIASTRFVIWALLTPRHRYAARTRGTPLPTTGGAGAGRGGRDGLPAARPGRAATIRQA